MSILPPEILYEILAYSIDLRSPSPSTLMTTCSVFHEICEGILYSALNFTFIHQISAFLNIYKDTGIRSSRTGHYHSPRSIVFDIDHHRDDDHSLFSAIYELFSRCFQQNKIYAASDRAFEGSEIYREGRGVERDEQGKLVLDLLHLRLNTYAFESDMHMNNEVYDSLSLINPRSLIWTGRDPPHHFSLAIVHSAVTSLCHVLRGYTNLTHLKLTHLTMFAVGSNSDLTLPILPSLRTLYFGQVLHLNPIYFCEFILHPNMVNLESVNLVDAYKGSIWGERLRRSDLERTIMSSVNFQPLSRKQELESLGYRIIGDPDESPDSKEAKLEFIRRVVVCRAKTERIMGGDRVEEDAILI